MATNEEMKLEYNIMGEAWKFFKKYYNTNPDWDLVMDEAREIGNKYSSKLCNDILIAYVNELERQVMEETI